MDFKYQNWNERFTAAAQQQNEQPEQLEYWRIGQLRVEDESTEFSQSE